MDGLAQWEPHRCHLVPFLHHRPALNIARGQKTWLMSLLLWTYVLERFAKLLGIMTHYGVQPMKECKSAADQRIFSVTKVNSGWNECQPPELVLSLTFYNTLTNHIPSYTESQSVLSWRWVVFHYEYNELSLSTHPDGEQGDFRFFLLWVMMQ